MSPSPGWPSFSPADNPLDALVSLSRFYGRDPAMVLAGGGNTSVKNGDRLHVKASGCALADIDRSGFVAMHRARLQELAEAELGADPDLREARFKEAILGARIEPERGQRPSVECLLHHLLPGRFVVHTHATVVNALTCCIDGDRLAAELFGDAILWLPYVDPGFTLARELKTRLDARRARCGDAGPHAILLANHGIVVAADDPDEIRRRTDELIAGILERLGPDWELQSFGEPVVVDGEEPARERMRAALGRVLSAGGSRPALDFVRTPAIHGLVGTAEGWRAAAAGPLTPDQIVYCTSYPLCFEFRVGEDEKDLESRLREAIDGHTRQGRLPPRIVLVRGLGLFALGRDAAASATAREVYADAARVMSGARSLGGIRYLSERQRRFIEDWEVEDFRRRVARGDRSITR